MLHNISAKGRAIRAGLAVFAAIGAAFIGFEAAKGWCALRACGVKTRW